MRKTAAKTPVKTAKRATPAKTSARKTPAKKAAPARKTTARRPAAPPGLGVRGRKLWSQLKATGPAAEVALEACRCVDRLDMLDRMVGECDSRTGLIELLAESRLQRAALVALLSRLGASTTADVGEPVQPTRASSERGSVDEIAERRAARRAAAADSGGAAGPD